MGRSGKEAIPHNYSAYIARSDFSSDALKFKSILAYGCRILVQNDGKDASKTRAKTLVANCAILL